MTTARPLSPLPSKSSAQDQPGATESDRRLKRIILAIIAGVVIILAGLIFLVVELVRPETPAENVERLRDVFIILVALESLLIGTALIVLIIQLASLINLLQNEVRPILHATSEAVNTLRGTADFLGENVVEPVIELKGYLAGLNRMLELMGFRKR